ncbi:MAG: NUDIX hydrolase [Clostridia bacterium]|nr:NUDIX hydrolase [Clostridia bacterium]
MLEKFVENEYVKLSSKYNKSARVKSIVLNFNSEKYFYDFKKTLETNRRGEVGFLLKRKNGKYVVIRSKKYPKTAFRIPTGGIDFDESAIDALYREVKEELGIKFEIDNFHGLLEYTIYYKDEVIKFYSYFFVINEISGELIKDATQDEITDYKEIDYDELITLSKTLSEIEGGWRDWALFRLELIKFFIEE